MITDLDHRNVTSIQIENDTVEFWSDYCNKIVFTGNFSLEVQAIYSKNNQFSLHQEILQEIHQKIEKINFEVKSRIKQFLEEFPNAYYLDNQLYIDYYPKPIVADHVFYFYDILQDSIEISKRGSFCRNFDELTIKLKIRSKSALLDLPRKSTPVELDESDFYY